MGYALVIVVAVIIIVIIGRTNEPTLAMENVREKASSLSIGVEYTALNGVAALELIII